MESLLSHAVMLPILHVSVTDVRVYRAVMTFLMLERCVI